MAGPAARARRRGTVLLLLALLGPGPTSCQVLPGAPSAGRRALADLFVVGTSPVQIPAMAVRDAWQWDAHPALRALAFPVTLTGQLVWHSALTGLHAVDLVATPLHLFDQDEAPRIYTPYRWPMPPAAPAAVASEAGRILLLGAGTVGGALLGRWFLVDYVPRALGI